MLDFRQPEQFLCMVDRAKGLVDRRAFSDKDIYEIELERIFARAWNFMAHDTMIPNPGDFFMNYIGEDRVIVVRDNDGNPQVLVNSCRHRGNAVCRAEEGHATSFMCTYHGWTYDLKGNLVGVPGFKEVYHEELDRQSWGLIKAAQVDTYHGFIFATLDPETPGLLEYLGPVGRMGLDLFAARGDIAVVPGIQKYVMPCNWKLATDNGVGDWYHPLISHASSMLIGWQRPARPGATNLLGMRHIAMLGEYGHTHMGPVLREETTGLDPWRERPEALQMLGRVGLKARGYPNIFPNLWVAQLQNQLCLRLPRGPEKTELWFFTLIDQGLPEEQQKQQVWFANHAFGPAGMLEQDDGENWAQSTMGTRGVVTARSPFNHALNLGHGEVQHDESGMAYIETGVNEHAQLWLHTCWSEWMAAETWTDLKRNHSQSPRGFV